MNGAYFTALLKFVQGLLLVGTAGWAPICLLSIGISNLRESRRLEDNDGPLPDDVRNSRAIAGQLVPMSLANLMGGALAGIGASLYVNNGKLRWPSSSMPEALIIVALMLTEFSGMAITLYVTRPTRAWITDANVFRSHLRQIRDRGWIGKSDLAEIEKRKLEWKEKTDIRPLRKSDELYKSKLYLPAAKDEWLSPTPYEPKIFTSKLLANVSSRQVWRWIMRKRLWKLGVPPLVSGLALALLISVVSYQVHPAAVSVMRLFLLLLSVSCPAAFYWVTYRVGRLDLVMTNRYFALERAQLRDCDGLIDEIKGDYEVSRNGVRLDAGRVVLRFGRWDICKRSNETLPHGHMLRYSRYSSGSISVFPGMPCWIAMGSRVSIRSSCRTMIAHIP